jgi:hypothetical protein
MFINPKDSVELYVTNIGDVVGVPDRHVNETGLFAIEFECHDFVGTDAAQFNSGLTFDHRETFGFAGVEVVAAGCAWHCGAEAYLSTTVKFDGFDEAASVVGVGLQMKGEEDFVVNVTEKSIPEVAVEGGVETWYFALFIVIGFVLLQFGQ